jgi:hypothetical protein
MSQQEKIVRELKALSKQNKGFLTAQHVVEFARDPETALHSRFEWNDNKAAEEYRIWQARQLLRVYVEVINDDLKPARIFVSLKSDRYNRSGGGYRPFITVLEDHQLRAEMLQDALEEFKVYRAKYAALRELARAFNDMETALVSAQSKKRKAA